MKKIVDNPISNFKANWQEAKSLQDANAHYSTLATVSQAGQVSMRTLVLREMINDSFVVFINDSSPKWKDLELSKQWELMIFWPSLMLQYRIRGEFSLISSEDMMQHWQQKPYDAKIIDHYYIHNQVQSSTINSREKLLEGINQLKQKYPTETEIPFPENAIGLSLQANFIEQWYGSARDRVHERQRYLLNDGEWEMNILVP